MKLKVCGMKYKDNIIEVATLLPDCLGFIFHQQSPRHFENTIPKIPKSIKKVGVFVDEKVEYISRKIEKHQLSVIQLHGHESPEFCNKLKRHYEESNDEVIPLSLGRLPRLARKNRSIEIIKVFSIKDEFDFSVLTPYEEVCDFFLFDTKGKLPGGNGYTFNWNVLKNYSSTKPFFLSGGIGLDQIENIKQFQKSKASKYCCAIDVNSKFEIEAGLKNIEDLKEFIKEL